jgi:hypothetical protein
MSIRTKAYLNAVSTLVLLVVVEIIVLKLAQHLGFSWILFVFAPIALLVAILFWLHRSTGVRCSSCNNLYGVSIGLGGWPSVPPKCLSCGANN